MPIPTDTFWNLKRLHKVFAISAVLMMGTLAWSILQDYGKNWREPQRAGRVWEAALVDDKLARVLTEDEKKRLEHLAADIKVQDATIAAHQSKIDTKAAEIGQVESDIANLQFKYNTEKANVTVDEGRLEAARTAGDRPRVEDLSRRLVKSRPLIMQQAETLAEEKEDLKKKKLEMADLTAARDALDKQRNKLLADKEALEKKRDSLAPRGLVANLFSKVRAMPLMGFINPSEKPTQDVLPEIRTDVAFMKIATVDRCRTCHVHIENKDFSEAKVLAFLDRDVAQIRGLKLPSEPPKKATDPSATMLRPGAVAMPEFWHGWATKVDPGAVRKQAARLKTLTDTVGPKADLSYDGHPVEKFVYDSDATDVNVIAKQNAIVGGLLRAWARVDPKEGSGAGVDVEAPRTKIHIHEKLAASAVAPARLVALRYPEDLRTALDTGLSRPAFGVLQDRYRRALVAEVNVARKRIGEDPLDDGPVMLAHPNLDLYVDPDSKHPFESVGCTSCHDGSGQETNFVLAAHMPRRIWVDQNTGAPVLPVQLDKPPREKRTATLANMLSAVYPEDSIYPDKAHLLHLSAADDKADEKDPTPTAAASSNIETAPEDAEPSAYTDPVTGATGRAVSQMRYWADKYEAEAGRSFELVYHEWDWPMRPREYLQANCVRCHEKVTDIRETAPVVYEGRTLFAQLGCANCHQMDSIDAAEKRQVGTDLRHVTAKLSPEYINTWIWAPKAFRPSTKMPHFFMLENNSSDEELRRTRQEARAITEYLVQTATPLPPKYNPPKDLKGNADNGLKLFTSIGCQACHTNLNNSTAQPGITVGHQWIVTDLIKKGDLARELSARVARETAQNLEAGLTAKAEADLAASVKQQLADAVGTEPQFAKPKDHKLTRPESRKREAAIEEEVQKRLPAALQDARATQLPALIADARQRLPQDIEAAVPQELEKRVQQEADEIYSKMGYNERQLYVLENLEAPLITNVANQPKYADGTPKPLFVHHGPELSGVGQKLTDHRTVEQARAWLFDWLKEPGHYSDYTIMPRLRLDDQQALDLAEYLLRQRRTNDGLENRDEWKAGLTDLDTPKLIEMTSLFLRSRYSINTSYKRADDDAELTQLATDALAGGATDLAGAKVAVAGFSKDQKRLVFLGKKLIGHYGCMSCHAINGAKDMTSPCANLSDWGQKSVDKLDFAYLDPHKHIEGHALPPRPVPMVNGLSPEAAGLVHTLPPGGWKDSISKPITCEWPEVEHSRTSWITEKLKNTRVWDRGRGLLEPQRKLDAQNHPVLENGLPVVEDPGKPYDKLRMPTFYLNDEQVQAIVTFVISNRDRLIGRELADKTMTPRAQQIAYGRYLTQKYNCINCHQIEENLPGIQQYFNKDDIGTKAPPSLRGEGNKIQHEWLFNFLHSPERLRPLPVIRMPSFPLTDEERTAIAAYFAAASNKEANELKFHLDPIDKYVASARETARVIAARLAAAKPAPATGPSTSPAIDVAIHSTTGPASPAPPAPPSPAVAAATEPGDDWWLQAPLAPNRERLEQWALEHGEINRIQLDPLKNSPAELQKNYKTVLFKARFIADLYNAPFPFVSSMEDAARSDQERDERFKKGESLFYDMQCLKCHVMGPPSVPERPGVIAPNLDLTAARLQRRWVRHWVQQPNEIQPGTPMPPFFNGLPFFDLSGIAWPASQGEPPEKAKEAEDRYGHTADEQAALLLDFIYAAGAKGYTANPPAAAPDASSTSQPAVPPQGLPPTAAQPDRRTSPGPGSPANAPVEKAPTTLSAKDLRQETQPAETPPK